jgi:hypothetical protein
MTLQVLLRGGSDRYEADVASLCFMSKGRRRAIVALSASSARPAEVTSTNPWELVPFDGTPTSK